MKWSSIASTVVALLLLVPSAGVSEDTRSDPVAEFNRGVALYREGAYTEAAAAFRHADQLRPTWTLLYNIAQCEASAKNYGRAFEAFEAYLSKGGDELPAERESEVIAELARLKNLIGSIEISAPDGATIIVDDFIRGTAPLPGTIKIGIGVVHRVDVEKNNKVLLSEKVRVSQGEVVQLIVGAQHPDAASAPTESSSNPSAAAESPENESRRTSPMKIVGWTGIGVGLSLAVGGAVTGGLALSIGKDLKTACVDNICPTDEFERKQTKDALALSTDILLGAAVVTAGVGIGLLIASHRSEKRKKTQPKVAVVPMVGAAAAAISVSGRF